MTNYELQITNGKGRSLTVAARIGVAVLMMWWAGPTLQAQSGGGYVIKKSTIDSGGGTVTGGDYRLTGTVGQHDAGPISGGDYSLTGGFWSPAAPAAPTPPAPTPDPTGIDKVRFVSFMVGGSEGRRDQVENPPWRGGSGDRQEGNRTPSASAGRSSVAAPPVADAPGSDFNQQSLAAETALRINLDSMHHVNPPYTGAPSIPFTACEGKDRWAGPPFVFLESQSTGTRFAASQTQSTPFYRDWSIIMSCSDNVAPFEYGVNFSPTTLLPVCATDADCPAGETCSVAVNPLLHVTGSSIVSSSSHTIENVAAACVGVEGSAACQTGGANVSTGLVVKTQRWGDVVATFQLECGPSHPNPACQDAGTCTGTNCTTQADASDFGSLVSKFRSQLGAPIKARGLLAGGGASGIIDIIPDLGFQHISSGVAAFQGKAYPYTPECMTNP